MGLADDLRNAPTSANLCCVSRARKHFKGEDLKMLNEVIEVIAKRPAGQTFGDGPSQVWLAKTLTNNGFKVSSKTLNTHFRGGCRCGSV
jgi:hypothetical protein